MPVGVYLIHNTKKTISYVGSSSDIERRWAEHKEELHQGIHKNRRLQSDWFDCKPKCFVFEVLEDCTDFPEMEVKEQFWINKLLPNVYNIRDTKRKYDRALQIWMNNTVQGNAQYLFELRKKKYPTRPYLERDYPFTRLGRERDRVFAVLYTNCKLFGLSHKEALDKASQIKYNGNVRMAKEALSRTAWCINLVFTSVYQKEA